VARERQKCGRVQDVDGHVVFSLSEVFESSIDAK